MVLEQTEDAVDERKKRTLPRMGDCVALTHYLGNGLVESDLCTGAAGKVTGRILSKKAKNN